MKARTDDTGMVEKPVDPRITYPCYKPFDDLIDVERLKSLDGYMTEKRKRRIEAQEDTFFLNAHRLKASTPEKPGSREIWLTKTQLGVPYNYLDLNNPELWERTEEAGEFSLLMDFIETLPFKVTGRMLIIYDDAATPVPAHRDHLNSEICHEFIWFRTNLKKPFYVLDHKADEKLYVRSYSAWFDTVNQFHGADAQEGLSFSIRVDGVFSDGLRERIPIDTHNPAATPALWACTST